MQITRLRTLLMAILVCGWSWAATGAPPQVTLDLPDTPLVDQDGRPVRFKSDVLGEKAVAIDFVFTTCGGICPVMGATFLKLQDRLGERLGKDISLIPISIDPATDTPVRMKEWGRQFGARPGWRAHGREGKCRKPAQGARSDQSQRANGAARQTKHGRMGALA